MNESVRQPVYLFEGFRLDAQRRVLFGIDGKPIELTPRLFDTLLYFVERSGQLLTKEQLLEALWPNVVVEEHNLNKTVSELRRVLGEKPGEHKFIVTKPGRGYWFVADVAAARPSDEMPQPSLAPSAAQPRGPWLSWAAGGFGVALAAIVLLAVRGPEPEPRLRYTPLSFEQDGGGGMRAASVFGVTWSPDSTAIAYSVPGQAYVRYLDSPVARPLTQQGGTYVWTTEGRVLLGTGREGGRGGPLSESSALWSVSALGGEPERVMDMPAGTTNLMTMTRDGSTVAAVRGDENDVWGIWTGALSSGTLQRYEPAPFESPRLVNRPSLAFSPDGRQLLLMWNPVDGEQAWLMPYPPDPARPPRRVLRELPTFVLTPSFSWMPDSRHIVVSTAEQGRPASLYVADTESGAFRLLEGGAGTAGLRSPVVAPDGKKLVVTEVYGNLDIVTLDLSTAALTPLIATNRAEQMPAWATHDSALVYVTDRSGGPEIWLRESDGSDRPVVTERDFTSGVTLFFMAPEVSPDLSRVAYWRVAADAAGGAVSSNLWMSSLAGGPPIRLTSDAEKIENSGSWSPDSKWFVYTVVDADNRSMTLRKVRTLGQADSEILANGEPSSDATPIWSPDGRWILYDDRGLKLISPEGGVPHALGLRNTVCAFARDVELLHCIAYRSPSMALVDVDFTGRIVREVGPVAAEHRPQTNGSPALRLTLTPDGTGVTYSVATPVIQLLLVEGLEKVALP